MSYFLCQAVECSHYKALDVYPLPAVFLNLIPLCSSTPDSIQSLSFRFRTTTRFVPSSQLVYQPHFYLSQSGVVGGSGSKGETNSPQFMKKKINSQFGRV